MMPLSLLAQQAFIALHTDTYDFGRIGEHDGLVTTTFTFTNTGSTPLVLTEVKGTCSCTVTKYSQEPIEPNGQGWITVTYNPNGRPGKFSRTVTIKSNAANGTPPKLHVYGEVIAGGRGITKNNINNNASIAADTDHKPSTQPVVVNSLISQVDKNIPLTNSQSTNVYVLIIANEKYKAGEGIMLDIIDAQNALETAQHNFLSAQYDYARHRAAVESDMGLDVHPSTSTVSNAPSEK